MIIVFLILPTFNYRLICDGMHLLIKLSESQPDPIVDLQLQGSV